MNPNLAAAPLAHFRPLANRFGGDKGGIALGAALVLIAGVSLVQLVLGAQFAFLLLADAASIMVAVLLYLAPNRIGSWFALAQLLQQFGIALICKTAMLLPVDSGLMRPLPSLSLCVVVIVLTGVSAVTQGARSAGDYRLAKYYGDPARWGSIGLLLLAVGETATWLSYFVNRNGGAIFGGFNPLVHFKIAGVALLANHVMRQGRLLSLGLVFALGLAVFEALLLNSKSEVAFRFAAYGLALFAQPIRWQKRLFAIASCVALIVAADRLVFPVIHVLRTDEFKSASVQDRSAMIREAFSGARYTWRDLRVAESSTIMDDYIRFLSTDDGFINRFGSLGYLDLTMAMGDPNVTRMSPIEFLRDCLVNGLPGPLARQKDYISFADKLWVGIDPRFLVGGFATMGVIASARMTFGTWEGMPILIGLLWAILYLWQKWYGSDIRTPLLQFVLIDSIAGFIDGDIQGIVLYLCRFFWQDLLVIFLAGYLMTALARQRAWSEPGFGSG